MVMIDSYSLPSTALKDVGWWEDGLLGWEKGAEAGNPSGSREAKGGLHVPSFPRSS